MSRKMYEYGVNGRSQRGRPLSRWLDQVKKTFNASSLETRHAQTKCMYGKKWKDCVNGSSGGNNLPFWGNIGIVGLSG